MWSVFVSLSFLLGCIEEGPANYARIVRCGFQIKSHGCKEYETDFPQDRSYKRTVSAAPSTFFFFHQSVRDVCNNSTNTF